MKFCAVICEYNPFHNGHAYQLEKIRKESGCDGILSLMSGNFTQRGEAAVADKFCRARHAVLCGADVVLELPAPFATAPAEQFAGGAVHILNSIPSVSALAFGSESGAKEDFLHAANALLSEDEPFRNALKEKMQDGTSFVRARAELLCERYQMDKSFLSSPNNVLGMEYCRALMSTSSSITPLPLRRIGEGYKSVELKENYSSASAIRRALRAKNEGVKGNLPARVYQDLQELSPLPWEKAVLCALIASSPEEIAACPDCSEGLENRLLAAAREIPDYDGLLSEVVCKRYTLSRLKRILMQNFLKISLNEVRGFLNAPLYLKTLAIKKSRAEEILSSLSEGAFPLLVRKSDADALCGPARALFEKEERATALYAALQGKYINPYETSFV